MSFAKVSIIGNLGVDPELKYTSEGKPRLEMRVATSARRKSASGEWEEQTTWWRVILFGERGVKLARQPAERDRFQLLLAGLESTPAALPPSKAGSDTTQESFLERSISLRRPEESKAGTPPPAPASKSPVSK